MNKSFVFTLLFSIFDYIQYNRHIAFEFHFNILFNIMNETNENGIYVDKNILTPNLVFCTTLLQEAVFVGLNETSHLLVWPILFEETAPVIFFDWCLFPSMNFSSFQKCSIGLTIRTHTRALCCFQMYVLRLLFCWRSLDPRLRQSSLTLCSTVCASTLCQMQHSSPIT